MGILDKYNLSHCVSKSELCYYMKWTLTKLRTLLQFCFIRKCRQKIRKDVAKMPSQKEKKKMDFSLTDRFFGSQANFLAVFRFLIKETGGITNFVKKH